MGDVWFDPTHPKARKEHKCQQCSRTIGIGERYRRQGYVYDGRKSASTVCTHCEEFAELLYSAGFEDDEGGYAYLPELDASEVAHCGFSVEHGMFRRRWLNDDGLLYSFPEMKPQSTSTQEQS